MNEQWKSVTVLAFVEWLRALPADDSATKYAPILQLILADLSPRFADIVPSLDEGASSDQAAPAHPSGGLIRILHFVAKAKTLRQLCPLHTNLLKEMVREGNVCPVDLCLQAGEYATPEKAIARLKPAMAIIRKKVLEKCWIVLPETTRDGFFTYGGVRVPAGLTLDIAEAYRLAKEALRLVKEGAPASTVEPIIARSFDLDPQNPTAMRAIHHLLLRASPVVTDALLDVAHSNAQRSRIVEKQLALMVRMQKDVVWRDFRSIVRKRRIALEIEYRDLLRLDASSSTHVDRVEEGLEEDRDFAELLCIAKLIRKLGDVECDECARKRRNRIAELPAVDHLVASVTSGLVETINDGAAVNLSRREIEAIARRTVVTAMEKTDWERFKNLTSVVAYVREACRPLVKVEVRAEKHGVDPQVLLRLRSKWTFERRYAEQHHRKPDLTTVCHARKLDRDKDSHAVDKMLDIEAQLHAKRVSLEAVAAEGEDPEDQETRINPEYDKALSAPGDPIDGLVTGLFERTSPEVIELAHRWEDVSRRSMTEGQPMPSPETTQKMIGATPEQWAQLEAFVRGLREIVGDDGRTIGELL